MRLLSGVEGQAISETSNTYYEERRETIADCLLATAVLLAVCLVGLLLTLVAIGIHYEVHTFGFDETTSDSPVIVVRRDLGLVRKIRIFDKAYDNAEYPAFDLDHDDGYTHDNNRKYKHDYQPDFKHDYIHNYKHEK
ncbi:hypothetical protein MTO96_030867 [Rhipicephalus appendiculatus]